MCIIKLQWESNLINFAVPRKETYKMSVRFIKLFEILKAKGLSSTLWLRQNGIHPTTVNKLKKNEIVNTETINKLCQLLNCQPGDIMDYVPDKE